MIAGRDAVRHGEAKNSWLTGTAAWTFYNVSQYILGIRPQFEGLEIDPCIPSNFPGFTVERKFRGATYVIEVDNKAGVQKGIQKMTIDGKDIVGNILPICSDNKKHFVRVNMESDALYFIFLPFKSFFVSSRASVTVRGTSSFVISPF